jgi:hypothetical protein
MKLRVLHDNTGRVLAAVPVDTNAPVQVGMKAKAGQSVGDFDVPASHANLPVEQLLPKLSVDVAAKQLRASS